MHSTRNAILCLWIPAGLILAGVAAMLARTAGYELLGFDSYPILLTSRVESWSELFGLLGERLMGERYSGEFYRPLLGLSFALDHALWGLDPFGYRLSNIVCYGGFAAAMGLLARRLTGAVSTVVPILAVVLFLLHPSHVEVVPVAARRSELLCGMFMAFAIAAALHPARLARNRPSLVVLVCSLLAIAAKETAFVLPVLVFIAALLFAPSDRWSARLRHASIAVVAPAVALVVLLAARAAVLGGLGGHSGIDPFETGGRLGGAVATLLAAFLFPQPAMFLQGGWRWLPFLLAGGVMATGLARLREADHGGSEADTTLTRAAVVAAAWVTTVAGMYAAVGWIDPWYFLIPAAGWTLLAAVLVGSLLPWVRQSADRPLRLAAGWTLLTLAALLLGQALYSPLLHRYDAWQRASDAQRDYFEKLHRRIDEAEPGTVVSSPPLPYWVRPHQREASVQGAAILADYSVQAWAELVLPDKKIRIVEGEAVRAPAGDEIVVLVRLRSEL